MHDGRNVERAQIPADDEWANTTWHIRAMEYDSALKRADTRTQATKWMNPGNPSELY